MRKESFKIPTKEAMKVLDKIKMHKIKTTDGAYLAHSCGSVCCPPVSEWVQHTSQQEIQESFPIYKKFPIMTEDGYREVPLELDDTLSNKPITLKPTLPVKRVAVTDMEFDKEQLKSAISESQYRFFFKDFNRILKAGSAPSLGMGGDEGSEW